MFEKVIDVVILCILAVLFIAVIICLAGLQSTPGPMPIKVILATVLFISIGNITAIFITIINSWRLFH